MPTLTLATLALLLLAGLPWGQERSEARRPRELDAGLQRLRLPAERPAAFNVALTLAGAPVRLDLRRHSLRASGARLKTFLRDESGERYVESELPPVGTYRGAVDGLPASTVLASLGPAGLEATILLADGSAWSVRPDGDGGHRVLPHEHEHAWPEACGVVADAASEAVLEQARLALPAVPSLPRLALAEVAFDADFEYFQLHGSSTASVVARIEAIMNEVDFFYARDVLITYDITGIVVRTAPFYTPLDGGDLLDRFRSEWETNDPVLPRDMGHLMTGKPGALIEYGGLAYVGVVCGGAAYGWSMDSTNIVAHELGHNWAAGHCHDSTPCNHMCGGCLFVGPKTKRIIEAHRDSRPCLDAAPPYGTPVAPYVHPLREALPKRDFEARSERIFDVLRTAHDANGDPLRLEGFDHTTDHGATLRRSIGSGAHGQDELVHVFPDAPWVGEDRARFTVIDRSGRRTEAELVIDLRRSDPEAHYPFDEGSGASAADLSGRGRTATAPAGVTWISGSPTGTGAVAFDGTGQTLATPELGIAPPWTVSAWVQRLPSVGPVSALAEATDGSLRTEQWGTAQRLGLTRFGVVDASFGFLLPESVWVHTTFVGTERETAFFVNGFPAGAVPFAIEAPTRPAASLVEPLRAGLDDFRVYAYALEVTEIAELVQGGRAVGPSPADGGRLGSPAGSLSFVPGLGAVSQDLYFGDDWTAVRAATPAAPEFVGNRTDASFQPGPLEAGVTYYWRVDTRRAATVTPGNVWQFELAERLRWRLDESSGAVAAEESGAFAGTYFGGPQLGQPGATVFTGSSVRFDGVNDRVRLPALDLNTQHFTATGWLRRNGAQSDYTGLLFSRNGATTAGLNFSTGHQLGYHWNGDPMTYGWDSGLVVPEGVWVFFALVIEPGVARIHLGSAGALSVAIHAQAHAPEEFDGTLNLGLDPLGGRWFDGWMDDVRVFDAALSAEEVEAIFLGLR